jgi:hypothetical protein
MKTKIPKGSFMRKCIQYINETIMHSSISSTSLARLMPREIHADVNAGTSLVECNREIDEREAQAKEC